MIIAARLFITGHEAADTNDLQAARVQFGMQAVQCTGHPVFHSVAIVKDEQAGQGASTTNSVQQDFDRNVAESHIQVINPDAAVSKPPGQFQSRDRLPGAGRTADKYNGVRFQSLSKFGFMVRFEKDAAFLFQGFITF